MALNAGFNTFKRRASDVFHNNVILRTIFIRYPQIGGGIMSAFKASGADYFAQTQVDSRLDGTYGTELSKNKKIDWTRNSLFAMLGFVHGGFINYFVHSYLNPLLFGTKPHVLTIAKQILFTQLVYTPLFAFPLFYAFRGFVYNNFSVIESKKSVQTYLNGNWKKDVPMAMKVWAPAHCITYSLIPLRYRIFWVNIVSFAWTTILSTKRGKVDNTEKLHLNNNSADLDQSSQLINNANENEQLLDLANKSKSNNKQNKKKTKKTKKIKKEINSEKEIIINEDNGTVVTIGSSMYTTKQPLYN